MTNTGTLEATNGGTLDLVGGPSPTPAAPSWRRGPAPSCELNGSDRSPAARSRPPAAAHDPEQRHGHAQRRDHQLRQHVHRQQRRVHHARWGRSPTTARSAMNSDRQHHRPAHQRHRHADRRRHARDVQQPQQPHLRRTGSDTLINDAGNTIQGSGQLGDQQRGFAFTLTNAGRSTPTRAPHLHDRPEQHRDQHRHRSRPPPAARSTSGDDLHQPAWRPHPGRRAAVRSWNSTATITGGTLTTTSGGTIQNSGTATLDGTTNGVTISSGSTVTLQNATTTTLQGTITNNGTIAKNSDRQRHRPAPSGRTSR